VNVVGTAQLSASNGISNDITARTPAKISGVSSLKNSNGTFASVTKSNN
jgi:hypothetical protein